MKLNEAADLRQLTAMSDQTVGWIVWRYADGHAVAHDDFDLEALHIATQAS